MLEGNISEVTWWQIPVAVWKIFAWGIVGCNISYKIYDFFQVSNNDKWCGSSTMGLLGNNKVFNIIGTARHYFKLRAKCLQDWPMHMAVSERMEEVQRKTSEKAQARHSQSWPGQYPVVCCIRAPGMTRRETNMSVTARESSNRLGGWRRARLHNTEIKTCNTSL